MNLKGKNLRRDYLGYCETETFLKHAMILSPVPIIVLRLLLPVKLELRFRRS